MYRAVNVAASEPHAIEGTARWPGSRVAAAFAGAVESGRLNLPLPGGGRTCERWAVLADLAGEDLSLARLAEGHADALAILAELGEPAPPAGSRWGAGAAQPPGPGLTASRAGRGWRLDGIKQYCSGAHSVTDALVTATTPDGSRLFAAGTATEVMQRVGRALGAGPLCHDGAHARRVAVTDGEASHPGADPAVHGQVRAEETAAALGALDAGSAPAGRLRHRGADVIRLRFPDAGPAAREGELAAVVGEQCAGFEVCLAPWERDGHANHEAAGRAARRAGLPVLSYPI